MELAPETALASFGYTQLEALVYCELLRSAPATGYRLSQLVGKAPASIYQVLKTLAQKGAVIETNGRDDATSYIPVPPEQLLAGIRHGFDIRYDAAFRSLESVHRPTADESVYQLKTVTQVLGRARSMLADAREVVLFDLFPDLYDLLRDEIDAARERGVVVAGIAYRAEDAIATMPFNGESKDLVEVRWPGLGLILIADGCRHLIAQLSRDMTQVLNGVYTDSVFLSCIFHSAVAADIRLVAFRQDPSDPLKFLSLQASSPPGLRTLLDGAD